MNMHAKQLKPYRTIVTSFNPRKAPLACATAAADDPNQPYEEGEWVLCLAASNSTIACALSSGEIQVYDQERLHVTHTFPRGAPHHDHSSTAPAPITSLVYAPQEQPILISTDASGALDVMDLRQGQRTIRATLPTPALSLGLGYEHGHLAAVGSVRGRIHFTDLRQPGSVLGTYIDSHTDDVTQVTFAPDNHSTVLLSGAEDGLVCLFDTTQPTEETARKSVCSVGTAVRHMGFCGRSSNIYCLTGSETLSIWHAESATVVRDYGWDTRSRLSQAAAGAAVATGVTTGVTTTTLDYLIDAYWNDAAQQLLLMAGTSSGDSVLFRVNGNNNPPKEDFFAAECFLQGGHRGVVRAWTPCHETGNNGTLSTLITAGEDARLCEWRPTPTFAAATAPVLPLPTVKRPSTGGGPLRRQRSKTTASPY